MRSILIYVLYFLYWVWFIYFVFYVIQEIMTLKQVVVGERIIFMAISTFVLFFVGLFLYLFTLTFEISNTLNKHLRSSSLFFCVTLIVLFFLVLRGNSLLHFEYQVLRFRNSGDLYLEKGDKAKAIESFKKALTLKAIPETKEKLEKLLADKKK